MQVSRCLFVSKLWHTGLKLTGMHIQEEGGRVLVCDLIQWFWFVTLYNVFFSSFVFQGRRGSSGDLTKF